MAETKPIDNKLENSLKMNTSQLVKLSLQQFRTHGIERNDVEHKLKSCFNIDNVKDLYRNVIQETIYNDGYFLNGPHQFATAEFDVNELTYIVSSVIENHIASYVVDYVKTTKSTTCRLKLIDLKHLVWATSRHTGDIVKINPSP
jgi:ribosomal protein S17E